MNKDYYTVAVLGFGGGVLHRIIVCATDPVDAIRAARKTMFDSDAARLAEWDSSNYGRGVEWIPYKQETA